MQWLVAITVVAELGDLTRFTPPRQLAAFVGLIPSEYSSGPSRRQGGITKAGNGRARRALIEAAWAYRHPAKVSQHLQTRIDALPKPIQEGGTQSTDISRINRRQYWPHLGADPGVYKNANNEGARL